MKHRLSLLTAALVFSSAIALAQTAPTTWKIDPAHSQAEFVIRHMGISNVHGRFGNVNGTITFSKDAITKSSVDATVDTTTVDTGVPQRDTHLKSADFFEVAKYPTMIFKSKTVEPSGSDYHVIGDLTLHGVTKPVTLTMDAPGKEQTGPDGKLRRGFTATTTIRRQDFGLNWNGTLKSGDAMLGDDVKITLDIESIQQ